METISRQSATDEKTSSNQVGNSDRHEHRTRDSFDASGNVLPLPAYSIAKQAAGSEDHLKHSINTNERERTSPIQVETSNRYERKKRGIFGWLLLIAFWLFNGFMLIAVVAVWLKVGDSLSTKRLGVHVGAIIIPVYFWAVGDLILGLCAYLTRGRRATIVTDRTPRLAGAEARPVPGMDTAPGGREPTARAPEDRIDLATDTKRSSIRR